MRCGVDHSPPPSPEVKEREELYLYSASRPLWTVSRAPRAVSTSVCKPEAASTVWVPDDEGHNARNKLNY